MTGVLRPRDAVRCDRRPASNLGAPRRLKPQRTQERYRVQHDLKLLPDATPHAGIVLVAVGTVSLVPHPPQRSVSDGVVAILRTAVMLKTSSLTSTPDPHRLLVLGRLGLRLAWPVGRDRCTQTLPVLKIGHERRARALAVPPKPVDHLDRVYRCVGTMKEHKQSPKLDRISARIMRPCDHLSRVTGYRTLDLSIRCVPRQAACGAWPFERPPQTGGWWACGCRRPPGESGCGFTADAERSRTTNRCRVGG